MFFFVVAPPLPAADQGQPFGLPTNFPRSTKQCRIRPHYVFNGRATTPKQRHTQSSPATTACIIPQPFNIMFLMRADCMALCLFFFASRVTDREQNIAPRVNYWKWGGWGIKSLCGSSTCQCSFIRGIIVISGANRLKSPTL